MGANPRVPSVDCLIGELLDHPGARAVLLRHVPELVAAPQIDMARGQSLRAIQPFAREMLTDAVLARIDAELAREAPLPPAEPVVRAPSALSGAAFDLPRVHLWDGPAPLAQGEADHDVPRLTVFTPDASAAHGGAVVVAPGGAYMALAEGHEGRMVGDWLAAQGYVAFVLSYRLVTHGYRHPAQLLDAQRALRWVRSHAARYGIDPSHVGMMGFSAGGHLTAMASTLFDGGDVGAQDPVERAGCRPDFAVLVYPAISLSADLLLGPAPDAVARAQTSILGHVNASTPPTFIFHTHADELVGPDNAIDHYHALLKARVPAELHVFEEGRHGLGLALGHPRLSAWPGLLSQWLRMRQPRPAR